MIDDGRYQRRFLDRRLDLYDSAGTPVWLEHPSRNVVDIVAIPLAGVEETALLLAEDEIHDLSSFRLYPGLDVFVLGFPRGLSGGGATPIWKRGTIATEPDIDFDGKPTFLIDTATREGMSGAPVYAREVGLWNPEGADGLTASVFGKGLRFVGVYSGRIHADDDFKAQLGFVWKVSAIDSVVAHQIPGRPSPDLLGAAEPSTT